MSILPVLTPLENVYEQNPFRTDLHRNTAEALGGIVDLFSKCCFEAGQAFQAKQAADFLALEGIVNLHSESLRAVQNTGPQVVEAQVSQAESSFDVPSVEIESSSQDVQQGLKDFNAAIFDYLKNYLSEIRDVLGHLLESLTDPGNAFDISLVDSSLEAFQAQIQSLLNSGFDERYQAYTDDVYAKFKTDQGDLFSINESDEEANALVWDYLSMLFSLINQKESLHFDSNFSTSSWNLSTDIRKRKELLEGREARRLHHLVQSVFQEWKNQFNLSKSQLNIVQNSIVKLQHHMQARVFQAYSNYVTRLRFQRKGVQRLAHSREVKLIRKALDAWSYQAAQTQRVHSKIQRLSTTQLSSKQRKAFAEWHKEISKQKRQRILLRNRSLRMSQDTYKRYFDTWVRFNKKLVPASSTPVGLDRNIANQNVTMLQVIDRIFRTYVLPVKPCVLALQNVQTQLDLSRVEFSLRNIREHYDGYYADIAKQTLKLDAQRILFAAIKLIDSKHRPEAFLRGMFKIGEQDPKGLNSFCSAVMSCEGLQSLFALADTTYIFGSNEAPTLTDRGVSTLSFLVNGDGQMHRGSQSPVFNVASVSNRPETTIEDLPSNSEDDDNSELTGSDGTVDGDPARNEVIPTGSDEESSESDGSVEGNSEQALVGAQPPAAPSPELAATPAAEPEEAAADGEILFFKSFYTDDIEEDYASKSSINGLSQFFSNYTDEDEIELFGVFRQALDELKDEANESELRKLMDSCSDVNGLKEFLTN
ncbi:MAG: hypothetical protein VW378_07950 [bacterium]